MSGKRYLEPVCAGCGAPLRRSGSSCLLFGAIASSTPAKKSPNIVPAYAASQPGSATFSLASLMFALTSVAITCGLWAQGVGGFGILFAIYAAGVLIVSRVRRSRRAKSGKEYGWSDRLVTLALSTALTTVFLICLTVTAFFALFITCLINPPTLPHTP